MLKYAKYEWVKVAAYQLEARQKLTRKNPFLLNFPQWIFPPALSFEQSSSWFTAEYKVRLFENKSIADLTGGMGIDSLAFSQKARKVVYVEQNKLLCEIFKFNISQLKIENIEVINSTAEEFLKSNTEKFDCIYLDPARRVEGVKVFKIEDCEPNILELKERLLENANNIVVKLSPMLSMELPSELDKNCKEITVLNHEKECKELVLNLVENSENRKIKVVHLLEKKEFYFDLNQEKQAICQFSFPQKYLYEPSASMMKAGPYKLISQEFALNKIHPNSHLYTSDILNEEFMGRYFEVVEVISFTKKNKAKFPYPKANLAVRNINFSVDELKKMLKISDGGEVYIFGTTLIDNSQALIVCKKVS